MNAPLTSAPVHGAELAELARAAAARGIGLTAFLAEHLADDPRQAQATLARLIGLPVLVLEVFAGWTPAFDLMPIGEMLRRNCLLFRHDDGLDLIVPDPLDEATRAWAGELLGQPFRVAVAWLEDIVAYLARCEESVKAFDQAAPTGDGSGERDGHVEDLSLRGVNEDLSVVVRLVRSTLHDALKAGASDVHFESGPAGLAIKFRIDGVLNGIGTAEGVAITEQVISRIKVLAELDISERRIPQDGRFKAAVQGREIDFRVSIMPSIFGEDAVLRILDKRALTASAALFA